MDHNPFLAKRTTGGNAGGARGSIERFENIEWQTRAAPPSDFENRLGDALVALFGSGVDTLEAVVRELNQAGVRDPQGAPWTEASFQALLRELGR